MTYRRQVALTVLGMALVAAVASASAQRNDAQRGDSQQREPQAGDQGGMGGVGITIFAEPNFRGLNATFRVDVPDLRKYSMNDRVDSLQIARGEVWEVCEDINYKGRCQVFSADQADLNRVSWAGTISSLRRVQTDRRGDARGNVPFAPLQRSRLVLFGDVGFQGQSIVVGAATSALRGVGARARSAKAYGGAWELCEGDRFRGRCITVTDSVPDFARVGFGRTIGSIRPIVPGRPER